MMSYPFNRPAASNPYGYSGTAGHQAGAHMNYPGHSVASPSGYPGTGYPVGAGGQPGAGAGAGTSPMGAPGSMGSTGGVPVSPGVTPGQNLLPLEQSYIENILRLNLGKIGTFYMTYENNKEWNAKIFRGRIEAAGRDHIIISDPQTGMRFLLLMVNLDYVTFDEELNYFFSSQVGGGTPTLTGR